MSPNKRFHPRKIWSTYGHFILILGFFAVTLVLRLDAFREPVKGSHAWLSAHTVMTLQIWNEGGISNYNFSPVYTYDATNNKHLRSLASGLSDPAGNYYYVSYPPFSFLLAYAFVLVFQLAPSLTAIQVLNVLMHLAISWMLYAMVCRLFYRKIRHQIFYPALTASILYLFSAQALWCHGYMYFADTVIQTLWVAGLLLVFEIFFYGKSTSWPHLIALGITLFLACYTEWLGYFYAASLFLVACRFSFENRVHLRLVFISVIAVTSALSLTVFQYAQIDGLSAFIDASLNKYVDRSGYQTNQFYYIKLQLMYVLRHYWRLHLPYIGLLLFLLLALFTHRERPTLQGKRERRTIFFLIVTPIILHHAVFLEFSKMHDFALLKSLVFFCLAIAVLLHHNLESTLDTFKKTFAAFSGAVIAILLALNLYTYYKYDAAVTTDKFRVAADAINNHASKHESIYFVSQNDRENGTMVYMGSQRAFSPQVQLLSMRNALAVKNADAALQHMKEYNLQNGIVFTLDVWGFVSDSLHIQAK